MFATQFCVKFTSKTILYTLKVIGSGEFGEVKSARAYVQRGDEPISAQLDLSKLEKDESGEWQNAVLAECSELTTIEKPLDKVPRYPVAESCKKAERVG